MKSEHHKQNFSKHGLQDTGYIPCYVDISKFRNDLFVNSEMFWKELLS